MGCMGMSHDDFCKCDFDEFESISKAWREKNEAENRDAWERTRILAAICIQPHVKNKVTPQRLMPMPWDKKKSISKPETPELTTEERRRRFEAVMQRLGDKIADKC